MDTDNTFTKQAGGASDLVWGVEAIALLINRTERQTNHMLATGQIKPARKIGHRWVVSQRALALFFVAAI